LSERDARDGGEQDGDTRPGERLNDLDRTLPCAGALPGTRSGPPPSASPAPWPACRRPGLSQYGQGQSGGAETVTLLSAEMPMHTHAAMAAGTLSAAGGGQPHDNLPPYRR
jgi:hypothetical protein